MPTYPGQAPIDDPRIDVLRTNTQGQTFEFEEARYVDESTELEIYYVEASMLTPAHPTKFSKHLPLQKASIDVVEIVCIDLRRMLERAEEYSRIGSLGPLGDITYDDEEGTPE